MRGDEQEQRSLNELPSGGTLLYSCGTRSFIVDLPVISTHLDTLATLHAMFLHPWVFKSTCSLRRTSPCSKSIAFGVKEQICMRQPLQRRTLPEQH